MRRNICPWCGKTVYESLCKKQVQKRKTPVRFLFSQCEHCHHCYGQNARGTRMWISFCGMLASVILTKFHGNFWLMIVPVFLFMAYALATPIVKMTEDEEICKENSLMYHAVVTEGKMSGKYKIYYFIPSNSFDTYEPFSKPSPIRIKACYRKQKMVDFYFLYEHPDNLNCITGTFRVFSHAGKEYVLHRDSLVES